MLSAGQKSRRARHRMSWPGVVLMTVVGLVMLAGDVAPATAGGGDHHFANFTLYYPVGTNKNPDISTSFRLSVLYGRVGSIGGVDLNGGVSVIGRDLRGLQLTGLYSHVGGEFRGVAATGLINRFLGEGRGLQAAGIANVDAERFSGVQFAGVFNFAEGGHSGLQLSTVLNYTQGESGFLQFASVANVSDGEYRGFQLSPGFNFAAPLLVGAQIGAFNLAAEAHGLQAGLINMTRDAHGLQIGALNLSHDNQGLPIGLYNMDEVDGAVDWVTFGSNLSAINTGVRTTVNRFHSMVTVGYHDLQGDIEKSVFLNWNYGYTAPLGRRWALLMDLGFSHIIPEKSDDQTKNARLHFALQARALVQFGISRKVALFAGGGVSAIFDEYSSSASQETEPLLVAGISLF